MLKVDPMLCPNCKGAVERQGRGYYCQNCNLLFRPEKAKLSTQEMLEEPLLQIRALKRKLRVLGALMALSGVAFLLFMSVTPLFLVAGGLNLLIGIYLML